MDHYGEDSRGPVHGQLYQSKPLNMDTKIHETKGSFCIEALLSKNDDQPNHSDTSRSISPSSTKSRSPAISPGCEEIPQNHFVPRPGLLNHLYTNSNALYNNYHGPPQGSAFHSIDGNFVQKIQMPMNHHGHSPLHQMQLQWLASSGIFYPRLPDLPGESLF